MEPTKTTHTNGHTTMSELHQRIAELEEANAALQADMRARDDLLQHIIRYNPNAIAVCDKNLHYMLVSDRYRRDYGVEDQQVIGRHHYDVFPEMPQKWRDVHQRCLAGAIESSDEDFFVREDGSITYNRWECRPWHDGAGDIAGLIMFTEVITKQKHTEQQLRTFETLVENALDGITTLELDGSISYANPACKALFGYGDNLIGKHALDVVQPEAQALGGAVLQQISETGVWQGQITYQRADGTPFIGQVNATLLSNEANEPQRVAAIIRDITQQQRTEEELRIAQFTLDNSIDSVHWVGPDSKHVYVNQAACRKLGYTREELLNLDISNIDADAPAEMWEGVWKHLKQQCSAVLEGRHRRKDGSTFPVEISANFVTFNDQEFICAMARDITERKRAEDELRTYQALVENAPDAISAANLQGTIIYANEAFRKQYNNGEEVVGKPASFILPEADQASAPAIFQEIIEQGTWMSNLTHQRPDGSTFPAQQSAFVIRDQQDSIRALGTIIRDITEEVQRDHEQQRMIAVLDNSPDFVGMVTLEGQPLYLNPAGQRLVGIKDNAAFFQTSIIDYIIPEEREDFMQNVLPVLQEQGQWGGELHFRHFQSEQSIPVFYNAFTVKDTRTGQPLALATVTRDLTEQKQAEAERAALQQQVIEAQKAALRELSTPLMPLANGVLAMPLIGTIDSQRAQQVIETLLQGVAEHNALVAILDITGVQIIDTQVANALISAARATRLLGAQVILTGIQPRIAQTLVHLGVDLSDIITRSSLQSGIAYALEQRK